MNPETLRQVISTVVGLACFDDRQTYNEFLPALRPPIPPDISACVEAGRLPHECINDFYHLTGSDEILPFPRGSERFSIECNYRYGDGISMTRARMLRDYFARTFPAETVTNLTSEQNRFLMWLNQAFSDLAPTLETVSLSLRTDPYFSRQIARYESRGIQAPQHTAPPTPDCAQRDHWIMHSLSIEGIPQPISIIVHRTQEEKWLSFERELIFAFEVLKIFLSPSDLNSILNPQDGSPQLSIVLPNTNSNVDAETCADSTTHREYYTLFYDDALNRIHMGATAETLFHSNSFEEDRRFLTSHGAEGQRYFPGDRLYAFLHGIGQAFYQRRLAHNPDLARTLQIHFNTTKESLRFFAANEDFDVDDLTIALSSRHWPSEVPLFSESMGNNTRDITPRAFMSVQSYVGDLFAELAFLDLIRFWRSPERPIRIPEAAHVRTRMTRTIFSNPDTREARQLIEALYATSRLGPLEWNEAFAPEHGISTSVMQSFDNYGDPITTVRAGYQWNPISGGTLGLGGYFGMGLGNPNMGIFLSTLLPIGRYFGTEAIIDAGLNMDGRNVFPEFFTSMNIHFFPRGNRYRPEGPTTSFYLGTSYGMYFIPDLIPTSSFCTGIRFQWPR